MTGAERGNDLVGTGNDAGIHHGARRPGIVAVVESMTGAVRINGPEAEGGAEMTIHVLPAVVEDAAVRHQRGMALKQNVVSDLDQIPSLGIHAEQVAHDVAVAVTVLGLTRRGDNDVAVGQKHGIDVADFLTMGELAEIRAVDVDGVDVVVVLDVVPHREDDLAPVEVKLGVAGNAVGNGENRPGFTRGEVD